MLREPFPCNLFPLGSGFSVVAVGIDRKTASGQEFTPDLDIFGIHELYQIIHDDVDTVLMEISVIAEGKKVELKGFAFNHFLVRNIGNIDSREVRLPGDGAEACKFGTVEFYKIVIPGMLVGKTFKHLGCIVKIIGSLIASEKRYAAFFIFIASNVIHDLKPFYGVI